MIMELHRQGLSLTAIGRQLGIDRKTVRRYIALGLEPPTYGPRAPRPRVTDAFLPYLRDRLAAYPGLTAVRLCRELRQQGFAGSYTGVKRAVQELRPDQVQPFEVRFETPPGVQGQVDFARFEVTFIDEPGAKRIVWLFSLVLGYSRLIWARFVLHQDLGTVLRCHVAAFQALGGAPREILYDRMKTAVLGQDVDGLVIYNRALLDLARHFGFHPPPSFHRLRRRNLGQLRPRPAARIGRKQRARSSARSATSARISSSPAASATLRTSTASCATGSTRWPTRACTPPPSRSSTQRSPRSARR